MRLGLVGGFESLSLENGARGTNKAETALNAFSKP